MPASYVNVVGANKDDANDTATAILATRPSRGFKANVRGVFFQEKVLWLRH